MKCVRSWLAEWVDAVPPQAELAELLTAAGLEAEVVDDEVIALDLTPNRGDCLSLRGIAREVAAYTGATVRTPEEIQVTLDPSVPAAALGSIDTTACPCYSLRRIADVNAAAQTPPAIADRLAHAGIAAHSLAVDITNYVMLETGQPLHAFDADKVTGAVGVRFAEPGERLQILDGTTLTLDPDMLLIVDETGPIALAGIMGGLSTAISETTRTILLEAATFTPEAIAGRARRRKLQTDASMRYERGVDPELVTHAMARATGLMQQYGNARAAAVAVERSAVSPDAVTVVLRTAKLKQVLGTNVTPERIADLLGAFGLQPRPDTEGVVCTVPSWRFDLAIEEDLIEEVARGIGYGEIPTRAPAMPLRATARPLARFHQRIRDRLIARGYAEAVTYSFVEEELERAFAPDTQPLRLANPISSEQAVLRSTVCPSLLRAAGYNRNRGQDSIRLFEIARVFADGTKNVSESWVLGGIATGFAWPAQWSSPQRPFDFYDIKGDVESLIGARAAQLRFVPVQHPALHPNQSAQIVLDDQPIGVLGTLHPRLEATFDCDGPAFLFEIDCAAWPASADEAFAAWSEYPAVSRDLGLLASEQVAAEALIACVQGLGLPDLREVFVFDVYQDPKFKKDTISIGLRLIFQSSSATLQDSQVDDSLAQITAELHEQLGVQPRQ